MILKGLLLSLFIFFSGCSISKETHAESDNVAKKIEIVKSSITKKEKDFFSSKDAKELSVYVEKEDLKKDFTIAKTTLTKTQSQYTKELLPLMKEDKSDDEQKALVLIGYINTQLRMINITSSHPFNRLNEIKDFIKNKDAYYKQAKTLKTLSNNKTNTFKLLVEKARTEYPAKKDDLSTRLAKMQVINEKSNTDFTSLEKEYNSVNPDFSTFSKAFKSLTENDKVVSDYSITQTKKVKELFQSYSKILTDMRERYYIQIGRISWHEGEEEYPTETTYLYPQRELSAKAFEYFDSVAEQEMGSLGGWGSHTLDTSWNAFFISGLALNVDENIPSNDNSADFWVENLYSDSYHKYTVIENGIKKETDWEKVDSQYFDQNVENLGMEIVSKPYGFYEDEKIMTAAPAGMGYVGNKQYGQWQNDSSGNSFWHYYGMYSFLNNMTTGGYSRNDYDSYSNNRQKNQGYYGKKDEYGTYGSSTYKNTRYSHSEYARTNKSDIQRGRQQTSNGSLRNAGHNARGRGPGGGGK